MEVGVGRTKATVETLDGTDTDALCTKLTAIYARSSPRPITVVDEVPRKRGDAIPGGVDQHERRATRERTRPETSTGHPGPPGLPLPLSSPLALSLKALTLFRRVGRQLRHLQYHYLYHR